MARAEAAAEIKSMRRALQNLIRPDTWRDETYVVGSGNARMKSVLDWLAENATVKGNLAELCDILEIEKHPFLKVHWHSL